MENIDKYLNALTKREITGKTPKELRLNGYRYGEYDKVMNEMYDAFRLEVLSGSYSVPEFIAITRKVEEAKKQVVSFKQIVDRTGTDTPMFRPLYALWGCYRRQVEKTAELVESINIMKLTQAASIPQPAPAVKETTPGNQPVVPEETPQTPTTTPTPEKEERRNLNDKNTPHPREYVGFQEMADGEHISRGTAIKMSQDPYYKPAFRYVGRGVRVDVDILHELERKKAIDKDKPIGANPRRGKK